MRAYQDLVAKILEQGEVRGDRTGTGTKSVFGHQMRFDLSEGFPLVTTKRTFFRGAAQELLWMLSGSTNNRELTKYGVHIWDEWADEYGDLGPIYGRQWRGWPDGDQLIDQIANVLHSLDQSPFSRRHIVSAWNVSQLPDERLSPQSNVWAGRMALAPCHALFQFYVSHDEAGHQKLSCQLYQRSADVFLGVPFNIAGYSLLVHLMAHRLGMLPGEFVWTGGDCHLYLNHLDQAAELLNREPLPLPHIALHHDADTPLAGVTFSDIELIGYQHHPAIKAPVSV